MSLPNTITIGRILLVPLIIWLIVTGQYELAFYAFIVAGISDAVDGFLAKRFDQSTPLGAYLDPVADKLMLVSIYVALGLQKVLPAWLVILVASRDVLIIGAILLSRLMDKPVVIKPLIVSKANTAFQIVFAVFVLWVLGFDIETGALWSVMAITVAALTVVSGTAYLVQWANHMANGHDSA